MSMFKIPTSGETFIHNVKDRCLDLITHNIWNGIKAVDIKKWFNNFQGDEEQYFAACILDSLIYRSSDQVTALANQLFTKNIINHLNQNEPVFNDYRSLVTLLQQGKTDPFIRLVTVANKRELPGKSSDAILRLLRRKLELNASWFITPDEIDLQVKNGIKLFIFIDDFLGTGDQFLSMFDSYGLGLSMSKVTVLYAPLVAHSTGINKLSTKYPAVKVIAGEYLDEKANVFKYRFNDGINDEISSKELYNSLLKKYNFQNLPTTIQYGHGNLGLTYIFEDAIPDSNIHILWEKTDNWYPLVTK